MNQNFHIFPDLPHSEMVFIRGGAFKMGSEDKDSFDWERPIRNAFELSKKRRLK